MGVARLQATSIIYSEFLSCVYRGGGGGAEGKVLMTLSSLEECPLTFLLYILVDT